MNGYLFTCLWLKLTVETVRHVWSLDWIYFGNNVLGKNTVEYQSRSCTLVEKDRRAIPDRGLGDCSSFTVLLIPYVSTVRNFQSTMSDEFPRHLKFFWVWFLTWITDLVFTSVLVFNLISFCRHFQVQFTLLQSRNEVFIDSRPYTPPIYTLIWRYSSDNFDSLPVNSRVISSEIKPIQTLKSIISQFYFILFYFLTSMVQGLKSLDI